MTTEISNSLPIVRSAVPQDLPQVLVLIQALAAYHGDTATVSLDDLRRDVCGPNPWLTLLVVARADRLLGYAALFPLAQLQFGVRGMDLHHLFVSFDERGKGFGGMLINAAIQQAKAKGCRYLAVGTDPGNGGAQQVYRAAGFDAMPAPGPRFRIKW